ncbi:MAG: hypothetical protein IKX47_02270 [Oscillospiraceae bacterium]|nr:hypothetical protein [Oscillospiraceae bacterium]
MKSSLWIKTLFRSPVRTIVTWVLLLAAAFQFTLSLTDYLSTRKGLEEAKDRMKGALSLEHAPGLDPNAPGMNAGTNVFLLTDPTGPGTGIERFSPDLYHAKTITDTELTELAALPGVAGIEIRTMTAGVSDYLRSTDNVNEYMSDYYHYERRLILEASVEKKTPMREISLTWVHPLMGAEYDADSSYVLTLTNIRVIGGDQVVLPLDMYNGDELTVFTVPESFQGRPGIWAYGDGTAWLFQNRLYPEGVSGLEPGRRYVFAVRVDLNYHDAQYPRYVLADDTLIDWWPYITDITDLLEDYLEGEEFAPLRELNQVTTDDWHTLDVVYTGDMSVIRRVADLRLVPAEGRFLEPEDEGKPVCVVNADFAYANGISLGDTLRLKLGDYPMEQYVSLGAVASTRGRYAENWTEQEFTIVGTWRDVSQGKYLFEDYIWAYSDAAVFVPASFLPEGAKRGEHTPGDVTLLIDADAMNAFVENELPRLEADGWITYWNDRGWPQMEEELRLVVQAALYKLLAFGVATLLVIALTVYLFVSRRSRDYAILRALGMEKGGSGKSLTVPLLCLTLAAVIPGAAAALLWYSRGGEQVNAIALVGVPVLILLPMLAALVMVNRMGNTSPLTLLQSKRRQK